jgi:hypothetical protein
MKKRLITFLALIMSLVMSVCFLQGCGIITVNSERDMKQVVATVSIDDEISSDIIKREVIVAYLNYGSMYTQAGHSMADAFGHIIDGLISDEIMFQNAMKEMEDKVAPFDGDGFINESYAKWNVKRYLTGPEDIEAIYQTKLTINEILDTYDKSKNPELKEDTLTETVRTVPTGATKYVKELSDGEKIDYVNTDFDITSSTERRQAFNKFISLLEVNNLVGDEFDGTVESTEYYKTSLATFYEAAIVGKYRDTIYKAEREKFTFEVLEKAYTERYEEQKAWSNAEFINALSNAQAGKPILYSAFGTYGYVYNLLLGANEEQTTKISEIGENVSDSERTEQRREILATTTIKDLRSTWILSGYDFDGTKFTGDYTFAKDATNSLPFMGQVKDVTREGSEEKKYSVTGVTEYNLENFVKMMNSYVYGSAYATADVKGTGEIYSTFNGNGITVSEYDNKINELLFAFSTDSGSLNTYKGYVIKPAVDGANTEEYVETFANAGRQLLALGGNSYIIVASDYGYHVMFYSQVFAPNYSAGATLVDYLNASSSKTENREYWVNELKNIVDNYKDYEDSDSYLYFLLTDMSSLIISDKQNKRENEVVNKYTYEEKSVTRFEKAYKNLIAE